MTEWNIEPPEQRWLFTDGTIATPPEIEVSGSRRRFRLIGTKQSFPMNNLHSSMVDAMKVKANQAGTELWMPYIERDHQVTHNMGDVNIENLDLSQTGNLLEFSWMFSTTEHTYGYFCFQINKNTYSATWDIKVDFYMLDTSRSINGSNMLTIDYSGCWGYPIARYDQSYDQDAVNEATQTYTVTRFLEALGLGGSLRSFHTPLAATKALLAAASQVEDLIHLFEIPVWRNGSKPEIVVPKIEHTNYTERCRNDLTQVVDQNNSLEDVRDASIQLIKKMRKAGMVVDYDESRMFSMNPNALTVLDVEMKDISQTNQTTHKVYMNVLSGECRVACFGTATHEMLGEAGGAWEVAKFKSELTGETDELLAYVQEKIMRDQVEKIESEATLPIAQG